MRLSVTIRRSLSLKTGHSIGLLDEEVELASFENTDLPDTVIVKFRATGEYSNLYAGNLEDKSKTKIEDKVYYLRKNEIIHFGENVSIVMTRHNYSDFRVVIETKNSGAIVYVKKFGRLYRLGKQNDPNEHSFKLYAVDKQNQ